MDSTDWASLRSRLSVARGLRDGGELERAGELDLVLLVQGLAAGELLFLHLLLGHGPRVWIDEAEHGQREQALGGGAHQRVCACVCASLQVELLAVCEIGGELGLACVGVGLEVGLGGDLQLAHDPPAFGVHGGLAAGLARGDRHRAAGDGAQQRDRAHPRAFVVGALRQLAIELLRDGLYLGVPREQRVVHLLGCAIVACRQLVDARDLVVADGLARGVGHAL
jgi:hypothetical protein